MSLNVRKRPSSPRRCRRRHIRAHQSRCRPRRNRPHDRIRDRPRRPRTRRPHRRHLLRHPRRS